MAKPTYYNIEKDKQERLVDACMEEFSSYTFSDASINRIIKRAEISRGSFYQYFEDKEDCYLEMLEKYGAKVDYLECPAGALDILRGCYRLVHLVEILDNNRCTVKCTQGSSSFTTAEMKNLIDGIFDRLAEMGVNDPMVTAYWQEWKEP